MSRYPIFYCAMPDVGAGFQSVEADDAFQAEQLVQQRYPGAITASLSDKVTDEQEIRRSFVDWLGRI